MEYTTQIYTILTNPIKYLELKLFGAFLLSSYGFFFNVDHTEFLSALLCLIVFDLITSLMAAKGEGSPIESRRVLRSAFKTMVYGILISGAYLTGNIMGLDGGMFTFEKIMLGFLAATELVSILENVGRLGFAVPKRILNQITKFRDEA